MLVNFAIGGIIKFASNPATIPKWVPTRTFQSQFTEDLRERYGVDPATSSPNKFLWPREIRKSNQMIVTVVDVIKNQLLKPFDEELQNDSLYILVSGMPVDNSISKCFTSIFSSGTALLNDFLIVYIKMVVSHRPHKDGCSETLTDTIKKFPPKNFKAKSLKGKVSWSRNQKKIRIQRDILGKLASCSNKYKSPIDIDAALSYPLAPINLPLCSTNGSIRKTNKSSLFKAAMSDLTIINTEDLPPEQELSSYFINLAPAIRA